MGNKKTMMKAKRYLWRTVAWLLWRMSEALRLDYLAYRARQLGDGTAARDFDGWLSVRIFGDEGGYRYESFREENNRLRTEVAALNRSVTALQAIRQRQHILSSIGQRAIEEEWWLNYGTRPNMLTDDVLKMLEDERIVVRQESENGQQRLPNA